MRRPRNGDGQQGHCPGLQQRGAGPLLFSGLLVWRPAGAHRSGSGYPTDFDGVVAGDPANWFSVAGYTGGHMYTGLRKRWKRDGWLPPNKVQTLGDVVSEHASAMCSITGEGDGGLNDACAALRL